MWFAVRDAWLEVDLHIRGIDGGNKEPSPPRPKWKSYDFDIPDRALGTGPRFATP